MAHRGNHKTCVPFHRLLLKELDLTAEIEALLSSRFNRYICYCSSFNSRRLRVDSVRTVVRSSEWERLRMRDATAWIIQLNSLGARDFNKKSKKLLLINILLYYETNAYSRHSFSSKYLFRSVSQGFAAIIVNLQKTTLIDNEARTTHTFSNLFFNSQLEDLPRFCHCTSATILMWLFN